MMSPGPTLMYWKLAIWKAFAGCVVVLSGTAPSCVLNWDTMTTAGRIVAIGGLIVCVVKFLDGLFDQTVSRLAAGKHPVAVDGVDAEKSRPAGTLGILAIALLIPLLFMSGLLFRWKHTPPPEVSAVAFHSPQ